MECVESKLAEAPKGANVLTYAEKRRGRWIARLLGPRSPLFWLIVIGVLIVMGRRAWQWRLADDESAFKAHFSLSGGGPGWVDLHCVQAPDAASLRHLERMNGTYRIYFQTSALKDTTNLRVLRGRNFHNVFSVVFDDDANADPWMKEICRPDSSFKAATEIRLYRAQITDATAIALNQKNCGLKAVTDLRLNDEKLTEAGIKEMLKLPSQLKSLKRLSFCGTRSLGMEKEAEIRLSRPDLKIYFVLKWW